MDTSTKLITGLFALFCFTEVYAYTLQGTAIYDNLQVIDGEMHLKNGPNTSMSYPNATLQKQLSITTSKGNFPVPIDKPIPVNTAKIGKAAVKFAKAFPPLALAVNVYDLVCDLSGICGENDQWVREANTMDDNDVRFGTLSGEWKDTANNAPFASLQAFKDARGCTGAYRCDLSSFNHAGSTLTVNYNKIRVSDGVLFQYLQAQNVGVPELPPIQKVPVTDANWSAAESSLNTQPMALALWGADAPLPVTSTALIAPVVHPVNTVTTSVRDSQGNVTGTKVVTTTVTITDQSTTNNIEYHVNEKTLTQDFDANNQLTGTEEKQSDSEPPKKDPPEDIKIENGKVDEVPLLTQTINVQDELDNAQQAEWSVYGSCPSDIDLGVYGLEFSLAPFCTFAENMRPIVLMLGAFFSFFILSGAKFN